MRWPVSLVLLLSLVCVGIEQRSAVAQLFPGIARSCGGCGTCVGCRSLRGSARRICRRCRRQSCNCRTVIPTPNPCAPTCAAPVVTRMVPRRVVTWDMVPTTTYRRQAYCEQVPVTTYRKVVVTIPQTSYRNVVKYQMVPQQTMVPQRKVSTVWEPRRTRRIAPMILPRIPAHTGGCSSCGTLGMPWNPNYPGMTSPTMILPQGSTPPTLTVPSTPTFTPHEELKVPTPVEDPNFHSTSHDHSHYYVPSHGSRYYEQSVSSDGYRTLRSVPQTASRESKFVPVSSAATVPRTFR